MTVSDVVVPIRLSASDALILRNVLITLSNLGPELTSLAENSSASMATLDGMERDQARMTKATSSAVWLAGLVLRGVLGNESARAAVGIEVKR